VLASDRTSRTVKYASSCPSLCAATSDILLRVFSRHGYATLGYTTQAKWRKQQKYQQEPCPACGQPGKKLDLWCEDKPYLGVQEKKLRTMQPATLARIFHELLSRDHEDGCATGQLVPRYRGIGSEAYLERYVAGAVTRGRQEGRPYPWSQQVIHEISGLVLAALLVAITVACATPSKQPNAYEECISLCSYEVTRCTRSCYNWKWSTQQSLDCVRNCNQKSAECQQQCSTIKEPTPEHHDQGGDVG
jgi:hypothetical protein